MTSSGFEPAVMKTLQNEGGLSNDARDAGGLTKYGISQRAYPDVDIEALTLDDAKALYKRDYWDKIQGDYLPVVLQGVMFDHAVNSGVNRAIKTLQTAVGVPADGILGPATFDAVHKMPSDRLVLLFTVERLRFLTSAAAFGSFGKGWVLRAISGAQEAVT